MCFRSFIWCRLACPDSYIGGVATTSASITSLESLPKNSTTALPESKSDYPVSSVSFLNHVVQRSGSVPMHDAASHVGRVVSDSHQAALALNMLARYGECGLRRLGNAVDLFPLVPASLDETVGTLPDVLPLHSTLVTNWCREREQCSGSCRVGRWSSLVHSMVGALFVLFCADLSGSFILPETLRHLPRRQDIMLEHLWQCASECLGSPAVPFVLDEQRNDLKSRRVSCDGDMVSTRKMIQHCLVEPTWPTVDEAAVCPIVDFISPHLVSLISSPRGCLRPVENWPSRTPRSCVFAKDPQWFATIRAAYLRGVVVPVPDSDFLLTNLVSGFLMVRRPLKT